MTLIYGFLSRNYSHLLFSQKKAAILRILKQIFQLFFTLGLMKSIFPFLNFEEKTIRTFV